jgi:hypothetical protein
VPPTGLPFADLRPGQTRNLPTRLVSLNPPDPQSGVRLPEKGEALAIGDIREVNSSSRVQKALTRLQAEKAATTVSQLVMWNVASGLEWPTIAELSRDWANRYELALARDFVDRLDGDAVAEGDSGQILFEIVGKDPTGETRAADLKKAFEGKIVLGLRAGLGIPARPSRPSLACRVQIKSDEVQVQLSSSDPAGRNWIPLGKFALAAADAKGDAGALKLADALAEGLIGRLVRAQVVKGARQKGKLTYGLRIDTCQWTRILTRLVNPNCYEPEARPDGGFLQVRHACKALGSSLLPTYPRPGSVADPLPDQHDGMDLGSHRRSTPLPLISTAGPLHDRHEPRSRISGHRHRDRAVSSRAAALEDRYISPPNRSPLPPGRRPPPGPPTV